MEIASWSRYRIIIIWCMSVIAAVLLWSLGSAVYSANPAAGYIIVIVSVWALLPAMIVHWTWLRARDSKGKLRSAKLNLVAFALSFLFFWVVLVAKSIGQVMFGASI